MSATLDLDKLARHLGSPALALPGRAFPVETRYAKQEPADPLVFVAEAVAEAARLCEGDILAFLPGMSELLKVRAALAGETARLGFEVLLLHGSLPLEDQRRVIAPGPDSKRRVILATSIAETSLTVPRVGVVVDSGLARSQRFDLRSGLNRLVTERETRDRAEQRRGRAGRLGPGICFRAWTEAAVLAERSPLEITRADLSGLVLEALAWGARKRLDLPWLDAPPEPAWDAAMELLRELGAIDGSGAILDKGRAMTRLGVEPRLASLVIDGKSADAASGEGEGGGRAGRAACLAAAAIAEGFPDSTNDFAQRVANLAAGGRVDPGAARVLEEAERLAARAGIAPSGPRDRSVDLGLLAPLLARAWPDRIGRRESFAGSSAIFALPAGRRLKAFPPLAASPWILALDADAGDSLGKVYAGLALDEGTALDGLAPLLVETIDLEWKGRSYRARRQRRAGALLLASTPLGGIGRELVAASMCERVRREGIAVLLPDAKAEAWLARLRFWLSTGAGEDLPRFDPQSLASEPESWLLAFVDPDPASVLPGDSLLRALEARLGGPALKAFRASVPERLELPSGSSKPVLYDQGPAPLVEARVQDFFGCTVNPVIAGQPVLLRLLSPAGRPVQVTSDLPGFWKGAWAEVRKELRGRYPKHEWPEHPETVPRLHRGR
jgi:ATP-dependent helicase HrpB